MRRALASSILCVAYALACTPAAKKPPEVRQAEIEANTGDWESALEKFRLAARENPNDTGIKRKVQEAERKCAELWSARASQANTEGRVGEAAEWWRKALDVTPAADRPKLPAWGEIQQNLSTIEYAGESASAEGNSSQALAAFLVLEMAQPDRPGVHERATEAKKGYANALVAESDRHWKRELAGMSLACNLKALQYDPMQDKAFANATDLRRVLKKRTRWTLDGVKIEETNHKGLAKSLEQKLTPRLDDYPPYGPFKAGESGGRATLTATIAEFEKDELTEEGVDEMPNTLAPKLDPVPNPAIAEQKAKIERTEKKLAELQAKLKAELEKKKKRGGKPAPVEPGTPDPGLVLARDVDKTRIDVASAKARLEQLPLTIIPPPPDPTWKLPWSKQIRTMKARVRFEFRDPDFADSIVVNAEHDIEKSDRTHKGNREQGVEPDALQVVDWDVMTSELAEALATQAVASIESAKKRRIDALLEEGRRQQSGKNEAEATNAYVNLLFIVGPDALPNDVAGYLETALEVKGLKDVLGPPNTTN